MLADLQKFGRDRRAFLIADCESDASFSSLRNGPDNGLTGNDAINAALYFPWVMAADPLQENRPRAFRPCGFVAGVYAPTDSRRGVRKAPAGTDAGLVGAVGVSTMITDVREQHAQSVFMHGLFRQGAFQGMKSQDAYFVKCDNETTAQNDINMGIGNIVIGFAPLKPAEFVIINIRQLAGQARP